MALDRAGLLALPQHSAVRPIAYLEVGPRCRRGSGVRLRELAKMAGVPCRHAVRITSGCAAGG